MPRFLPAFILLHFTLGPVTKADTGEGSLWLVSMNQGVPTLVRHYRPFGKGFPWVAGPLLDSYVGVGKHLIINRIKSLLKSGLFIYVYT